MVRQEAEYSALALKYPNDDNENTGVVTVVVRSKIVEWCFRVVEFCKQDTEAVFIAMNYTDRVCMNDPSMLTNIGVYQLVVVSSLYTAAKIHAPEAMHPKLMAQMSQQVYTAEVIEEMERNLLSNLQWRLNPPTAFSFVRQYLQVLSPLLSDNETRAVTHLALQQLDDYGHINYCSNSVRESVLSFCAVLNALEQLPLPSVNEKRLALIGHNLAHSIGIDAVSDGALISALKESLFSRDESLFASSMLSPKSVRIRVCEPTVDGVVAGKFATSQRYHLLTAKLS